MEGLIYGTTAKQRRERWMAGINVNVERLEKQKTAGERLRKTKQPVKSGGIGFMENYKNFCKAAKAREDSNEQRSSV